MKKSVKKNSKPAKPAKNPAADADAQAAPAESAALKPNPGARARERVEASRKAVLNKVIYQAPV